MANQNEPRAPGSPETHDGLSLIQMGTHGVECAAVTLLYGTLYGVGTTIRCECESNANQPQRLRASIQEKIDVMSSSVFRGGATDEEYDLSEEERRRILARGMFEQ